MEMVKLIFWLSILILGYTYAGYYLLLNILARFVPKKNEVETQEGYYPTVSIIVAAYNEEKVIRQRIRNLLELEYPKDKLEIIIACDGSTDRTEEVAKGFEKEGIVVLRFRENRGRASVHNDSVKLARGDIVVFTDADTVFERYFVSTIALPFCSPKVGCVVGNLIYRTDGTAISESEGVYWNFEKKLRKLESSLGILVTATGACMALRKDLWRDLTPIDDCDHTTPLDAILQGYKVVYVPDAVTYDMPPSSIKGELRARIRQTSGGLVGTLKRWGIKGWIQHSFVSGGLLSHKLLRWFTPFFMIEAFVSNLFLLNEELFYQLVFIIQAAFYLTAMIGLVGDLLKKRIPAASTVFSFCVANIGMGIGVIKGIIGKAPASYKMTE